MTWILIVTWLHFNSPNMVIEFNSEITCEAAREVIRVDIERRRLEIQANLHRDNPGTKYNPVASLYCVKK